MKELKKIPLDIVLTKQLKLDVQQCVYSWILSNSGVLPDQLDYKIVFGMIEFYENEFFINPLTYIQPIIETTVSEYFKIPLETIYKKTRKGKILEKRQIIQYFLYKYKDTTGQSLRMIGSITGLKAHASILHSAKVINNYYNTENSFRNMIDELSKIITEKILAVNAQKEAFLKILNNMNNLPDQLSVSP